jgi:hypothetical protein
MEKEKTVATVSVEQVAEAFVHAIKLANTLGIQQSAHLKSENYQGMSTPTRNNVVKSWSYVMDGDPTEEECTHRYDISTFWTDVDITDEEPQDDDSNSTVCDLAFCINIDGIEAGLLNRLIAKGLDNENDVWYSAPESDDPWTVPGIRVVLAAISAGGKTPAEVANLGNAIDPYIDTDMVLEGLADIAHRVNGATLGDFQATLQLGYDVALHEFNESKCSCCGIWSREYSNGWKCPNCNAVSEAYL